MAKYNEKHEEIPDNTPVELPIGYTEPESLEQVIARMIQANDFRKAQEAAGLETFEEADDFDVMDEGDIASEHEMDPMQEEYVIPKEERVPRAPVVGEDTRSDDTEEERSSGKKVEKKRKSKGKAVVVESETESVDEDTVANT